jgi:hypothetical protein
MVRSLAMAAILFAAVGAHIVHPLYHICWGGEGHIDVCSTGCYEHESVECGCNASAAHGPAVHPDQPECPICSLLKAFHSGDPAPAPPASSYAITVAVGTPHELAAAQPFAWLPFGARGPPSSSIL